MAYDGPPNERSLSNDRVQMSGYANPGGQGRRRTELSVSVHSNAIDYFTIGQQGGMLGDSPQFQQDSHTGRLPHGWNTDSFYATQGLSRLPSISPDAGLRQATPIIPSQNFSLDGFHIGHIQPPTSSEEIARRPTTAIMSNRYPPHSYSGTHMPIRPHDMGDQHTTSPVDSYAAGSHFFHTDFLPISPPSPSDPSGGNMTSVHLMALEEEKRRRNTAASARFRVKKKEREQALEKTANEMGEKVAILESRLGQLEMENKWLRGLITEKSRKMGAAGEGSVADGGGAGANAGKKKKKSGGEDDSQRSPSKRTDGVGTK